MFNRRQTISCHDIALIATHFLALCIIVEMTVSACAGEAPAQTEPDLQVDSIETPVKPEMSQLRIDCGPSGPYLLMVYCAALVAFVATLVFTIRGSSPFLCVAPLALPLIAGAYAFMNGLWQSHIVISQSAVELKLSELSGGLAYNLYSLREAFILATPTFILAISGLLYRALIRTRAGD
jgi:hypothetical protein